jgi:hypothetical protein
MGKTSNGNQINPSASTPKSNHQWIFIISPLVPTYDLHHFNLCAYECEESNSLVGGLMNEFVKSKHHPNSHDNVLLTNYLNFLTKQHTTKRNKLETIQISIVSC